MKMFEEFIQADYELDQIIKKIMERIRYWFQDGSFSLSSMPIDQSKSSTPNAAKRSIITDFADSEFYFQMIIRFYVEDLENCDVIIKKYDPSKIDEQHGGEPIWTIELTNDNQIKINDVKEDFIIKEISKMDDRNENPDENKIKVPKEKEGVPSRAEGMPPGTQLPPGEQMPLAQESPPAQAPTSGTQMPAL